MDQLASTVRDYAWGSTTAIPELLGTEPTGEPQAELWMGAHPGAPSRVDRGTGPRPLDAVIDADPEGELGRNAVDRFGPRLPFLLKVLAAAHPLSVQVHPDAAQARAGFAAENDRGIPLDAPNRTYKDPHHKPEMIVALTPFDGLCGFREPARTADLLDLLAVPALKPHADLLRTRPAGQALRDVLATVLGTDREVMAAVAADTAAAAARIAAAPGPWSAACAGYAAAARDFPGDPGVVAALLLNHVTLVPGEALHLGAGVPHAYLRGLGVEIMANSDNVLRCGLTPKHIDVPELLRVVRFEPGEAGVLTPEPQPDGAELYPAPTAEFRLARHRLTPGADPHPLPAGAPRIVLCVEGTARLTGEDGRVLELPRGAAAFVPAREGAELSGAGTAFDATTGA
jgi:mannose-6-phosphate isomerase